MKTMYTNGSPKGTATNTIPPEVYLDNICLAWERAQESAGRYGRNSKEHKFAIGVLLGKVRLAARARAEESDE
jgi:hypothetical protein